MPFFGLDLQAAGKWALRQADAGKNRIILCQTGDVIGAPGDYVVQ